MTPETRAAAHVALAQHSPYLFTDIPEGLTCAQYKALREGRKRTRWQRIVRRLNGHG